MIGAGKACQWREDDDGIWHSCESNAWVFEFGGTPAEHGMKFCPFCARPLEVIAYTAPFEGAQE